MPINGFSLGRDLTFTLVGPSGTLIIPGVTDYSAKPVFTKLKHKAIDGSTQQAAIPDGWEISIKLDRQDPTLDNFFAGLEASYFAGQNISNGTCSENIQEVDGSVSKFQYTNVSLSYDNAGDYKGDSFVPQALSGMASRRTKLS
jgi:hypothetical protein